jgi:hypothetical protein
MNWKKIYCKLFGHNYFIQKRLNGDLYIKCSQCNKEQ